MNERTEELLEIAGRLERFGLSSQESKTSVALDELYKIADQVGKAWSGSWLGYHALVYYENLNAPPAGAHFSQEWGLMERWPVNDTTGQWREYTADEVETAIWQMAGSPDLRHAQTFADDARRAFETEKTEVLSLLATVLTDIPNVFLSKIQSQVEKDEIPTKAEVILHWQPKGRIVSRDSLALSQGFRIAPPHLSVLAEIESLRQPSAACERLALSARKAVSHIRRTSAPTRNLQLAGTNVFIGHGRSLLWRELKDFIQDRLQLPWDEFNRIPVAGNANIARLSEMMSAAAIAFLIMTGEDEQADGKIHARMNVAHEAGLFQGRLGFTRAIILLEDGCEEFSNIHGLGQIRFPKDNIRAAFDEVRQILEREGLLTA